MPKPPNPSFQHLFFDRCLPPTLSNIVISNYFLSGFTTHPTHQHLHLCYTYSLPPNNSFHTTSPVLSTQKHKHNKNKNGVLF